MWEQIYLEMTDGATIGIFSGSLFETSVGYVIATTLTLGIIAVPFVIGLKLICWLIGGFEK